MMSATIDVPAIVCQVENVAATSISNAANVIFMDDFRNLLTIDRDSESATVANFETLGQEAEVELTAYRYLSSGWDGYGAEPPSQLNIDKVEAILSCLQKHFENETSFPSEITPGPASDGSIDLDIAFKDKRLILSVQNEGKILGVYREDNGHSNEFETPFDFNVVEAQLSWLYSKIFLQEASC